MKIIYLLVLLGIIFASGNHASNHDHSENFGLETMIALSKLASTETEDSTRADDLVNPVKVKEMMDVMKMMKIPTDSESVEKMKEMVEVMDKLSADMKNIKKMTEMAVVMNKLPLDLNIDMMSKSMTSSNKKSDSDSIDVNDVENEIERMSTISENLKKILKSQSAENFENTVSFDREVESFEDPDIHLQIKGNSFVVLVDDMPIFSGKHKNITIRFINGEGAIYLDELVPVNPYDGEVIDVVASDDEQILGESSLEEELYSLNEHDEGLLIEPKGKDQDSANERVKRASKHHHKHGKRKHHHHKHDKHKHHAKRSHHNHNKHKHHAKRSHHNHDEHKHHDHHSHHNHDEHKHHDHHSHHKHGEHPRKKRSYRIIKRRNLRLSSNFQYSYPKYGQTKYYESPLNYHEICKDYHHHLN